METLVVAEKPSVARDIAPELEQAIGELEKYRWLVFTSPVGPGIFFERLRRAGKDARALAGLKLAAIGPVTAKTLADNGLPCHIQPEAYTIPALVEALKAHYSPQR